MTKNIIASVLLCLVITLAVPTRMVQSIEGSHQRRQLPLGGASTRPQDLTRRIQSWMIQRQAIPKTRSLRQTSRGQAVTAATRGSVLTIQKPTKANICKWFGVDEDPGNLRCMLRRQFNHDAVGMTNPSMQIISNDEQDSETKLVLCSTSHDSHTGQVVATKYSENQDAAGEANNNWWPSLSFSPSQPRQWRIITHRRRVGRGWECYDKVRNAALDWEFNANEDMGLLLVPSSPSATRNSISDTKQRQPIIRGRYTINPENYHATSETNSNLPLHQCLGAARRLVSYSAQRVVPFLPKIYSINPIMVVYDVVDQRGPATTYTSTAYATMKGHLLRGEERVTVALRDGTEDVEVEILSISRAGPSAMARAIWPWIGKMQDNFFKSQMNSLSSVGAQNSKSASQHHQGWGPLSVHDTL